MLLADYLVHNETSLMFNSAYGMEIGCGVGLCGLALSRVAKRVFLTGIVVQMNKKRGKKKK